jgi:hypothetical protein
MERRELYEDVGLDGKKNVTCERKNVFQKKVQ